MPHKISIIIPVFQIETYLDECIQSILHQTIQDYELILVDDGSPDNCGRICDRYRSSNIQVIHQEHQGVMAARMKGFSVASGQYIAFVDGDDWIEPDFCEVMVETAQREQADIVMCSYFVFDENKSKLHTLPHLANDYLKICKEFMTDSAKSIGTVWSKLYSRSVIAKSSEHWDTSIVFGEDSLMEWSALRYAEKVIALPDKFLYHYRQHPESTTHRYIENLMENNQRLMSSLKKIVWQEELQPAWESYIAKQICVSAYSILVNETKHRSSYAQISTVVDALRCSSKPHIHTPESRHIRMCLWFVDKGWRFAVFSYIKLYSIYRILRGER